MTVKQLADSADFSAVCLPSEERRIDGAYVGDLLSWVMGRANADNAWITIMSNVNVIAVATLTDVACVIFAEGVVPDDVLIDVASQKNVNILTTSLPAYEAALRLSELI